MLKFPALVLHKIGVCYNASVKDGVKTTSIFLLKFFVDTLDQFMI